MKFRLRIPFSKAHREEVAVRAAIQAQDRACGEQDRQATLARDRSLREMGMAVGESGSEWQPQSNNWATRRKM